MWAIPATRMKMKRDHRMPSVRAGDEILDAARAVGGWTSSSCAVCSNDAASAVTALGRPAGLGRVRILSVIHRCWCMTRD